MIVLVTKRDVKNKVYFNFTELAIGLHYIKLTLNRALDSFSCYRLLEGGGWLGGCPSLLACRGAWQLGDGGWFSG
jgi:hypothetical protein